MSPSFEVLAELAELVALVAALGGERGMQR